MTPEIELLLLKYAKQNGLDPNLVRKVVEAESGGDPTKVSPRGAQGLMQLMPGTAHDMGVDDPFDAEQNLMGGTKYLAQLHKRFGDTRLALAANNFGPENVAAGKPWPEETQNYVTKIAGPEPVAAPVQPAAKKPDFNTVVNDPDFKKFDPVAQTRIVGRLFGPASAAAFRQNNPGDSFIGASDKGISPTPSTPAEALERIGQWVGNKTGLRTPAPVDARGVRTTGEVSPTPTIEEQPLNETDAAAMGKGLLTTALAGLAPLGVPAGAATELAAGTPAAAEILAHLATTVGLGGLAANITGYLGRKALEPAGMPETGQVLGEIPGMIGGGNLGATAVPMPKLASELPADLASQLLNSFGQRVGTTQGASQWQVKPYDIPRPDAIDIPPSDVRVVPQTAIPAAPPESVVPQPQPQLPEAQPPISLTPAMPTPPPEPVPQPGELPPAAESTAGAPPFDEHAAAQTFLQGVQAGIAAAKSAPTMTSAPTEALPSDGGQWPPTQPAEAQLAVSSGQPTLPTPSVETPRPEVNLAPEATPATGAKVAPAAATATAPSGDQGVIQKINQLLKQKETPPAPATPTAIPPQTEAQPSPAPIAASAISSETSQRPPETTTIDGEQYRVGDVIKSGPHAGKQVEMIGAGGGTVLNKKVDPTLVPGYTSSAVTTPPEGVKPQYSVKDNVKKFFGVGQSASAEGVDLSRRAFLGKTAGAAVGAIASEGGAPAASALPRPGLWGQGHIQKSYKSIEMARELVGHAQTILQNPQKFIEDSTEDLRTGPYTAQEYVDHLVTEGHRAYDSIQNLAKEGVPVDPTLLDQLKTVLGAGSDRPYGQLTPVIHQIWGRLPGIHTMGESMQLGNAGGHTAESPVAQAQTDASAVTNLSSPTLPPREIAAGEPRRKTIAEMTPDEMRDALSVDRLTGLGSKMLYEDQPRKAIQGKTDIEGLAFANDHLGEDAGNQMLKAVGQAFKDAGVQAYRMGGDEFAFEADSPEEAESVAQNVKDRLQHARVIATLPDGSVQEYEGIGLHHGIGKTYGEADRALMAAKAAAKASGERAERKTAPIRNLRPVTSAQPEAAASAAAAAPSERTAAPVAAESSAGAASSSASAPDRQAGGPGAGEGEPDRVGSEIAQRDEAGSPSATTAEGLKNKPQYSVKPNEYGFYSQLQRVVQKIQDDPKAPSKAPASSWVSIEKYSEKNAKYGEPDEALPYERAWDGFKVLHGGNDVTVRPLTNVAPVLTTMDTSHFGGQYFNRFAHQTYENPLEGTTSVSVGGKEFHDAKVIIDNGGINIGVNTAVNSEGQPDTLDPTYEWYHLSKQLLQQSNARQFVKQIWPSAEESVRVGKRDYKPGEIVEEGGNKGKKVLNVVTRMGQRLGGILSKYGITPDEIYWSGLDDWLKAKGDQPVTKQELWDYVKEIPDIVKEIRTNQYATEYVLSGPARQNFTALIQYQRPTKNASIEKLATEFQELLEVAKEFSPSYYGWSPDYEPAEAGVRTSHTRAYNDPDGTKAWNDFTRYKQILQDYLPKYGLDPENYTATESDWQTDGSRTVTVKGTEGRFSKGFRAKVPIESAKEILLGEQLQKEFATQISKDKLQNSRYSGGHWGSSFPDILSHFRANTRSSAEGGKTLNILHSDEFQGDPGQAIQQGKATLAGTPAQISELQQKINAASKAYGESLRAKAEALDTANERDTIDNDKDLVQQRSKLEEMANELARLRKGIPPMPFIQNSEAWMKLIAKRMLWLAAQQGADRITWTTGSQQVERWAQRFRYSATEIKWNKTPKGIEIEALQHGSPIGFQLTDDFGGKTPLPPDMLANAIQEKYAKQIIDSPDQSGSIKGPDLRIDDLGMYHWQDKMVPKIFKEIGKQWDLKVTHSVLNKKAVADTAITQKDWILGPQVFNAIEHVVNNYIDFDPTQRDEFLRHHPTQNAEDHLGADPDMDKHMIAQAIQSQLAEHDWQDNLTRFPEIMSAVNAAKALMETEFPGYKFNQEEEALPKLFSSLFKRPRPHVDQPDLIQAEDDPRTEDILAKRKIENFPNGTRPLSGWASVGIRFSPYADMVPVESRIIVGGNGVWILPGGDSKAAFKAPSTIYDQAEARGRVNQYLTDPYYLRNSFRAITVAHRSIQRLGSLPEALGQDEIQKEHVVHSIDLTPEARASILETGFSQYKAEQPAAAAAPSEAPAPAPAPAPITLEQINAKLPPDFQSIEQNGHFIVKTPGGHLTISPVGEISIDPAAMESAYGAQKVADVQAGEARAVGVTRVFGPDAWVQVVKAGALPHEVGGHVWLRLFASPEEAQMIQQELQAKADAEGKDWEEVWGESYEDFHNHADEEKQDESLLHTVYRRIRDFFLGLYDAFYPSVKGTQRKIYKGKGFTQKAPAAAAPPETSNSRISKFLNIKQKSTPPPVQ